MDLIAFRTRRNAIAELVTSLDTLRMKNVDAYDGSLALPDLLAERGHRLRRPNWGALGGGLFELRCREGGIQSRMLYVFEGARVAVLTHGIVKKKGPVPQAEIRLAHRRLKQYREDPERHGQPLG